MFTQTWNKYIPVLKILLKKSASGEQTLSMNSSDFQRAAAGRKIKFSFSINLRKGKLASLDNPPPLARDFAESLQNDETIRQLIRANDYELTLTNNFQLMIKNITVAGNGETAPEPES